MPKGISKYSICYKHNMALREVQPLENEEWDELVAELNKEPEKEKVEFLQKAVENGQKLKVHR